MHINYPLTATIFLKTNDKSFEDMQMTYILEFFSPLSPVFYKFA